ncbi:MAG: hypothetical protein ACI9R6_000011 [Saprospiraceae bacterium]|jgi:hypothetical protein
MSEIPEEHISPNKKTEIVKTLADQDSEASVDREEVINTSRNQVSENNRRHFKYRDTRCLNCKQPLDTSDRYCPYCSQLNSNKALSLKDFFLEFLSSLVSYDSKLRYTVNDLLFKPGTITRNFIIGQRLKYSNPFRFFLSVSIIYFLLNSVVGFFSPSIENPLKNSKTEIPNDGTTLKNDKRNFYSEDTDEDVANAIALLDANPATKKLADELRKKDSIRLTNTKEKNFKKIRVLNGDTVNEHNYAARKEFLKTRGNAEGFLEKLSLFRDFYKETNIQSSSIALDSLKMTQSKTNLWLYNKNESLERIEKDPISFAQFLISKTPFFLFFFAPLYALPFWILYMRSQSTYMEHLVFIFHIFSFIFLVLLLTAIPSILFDTEIFTFLLLGFIAPFYFYKALRNFYKQSRLKTIIKFVFLSIIFIIIATTTASLFFTATAATY